MRIDFRQADWDAMTTLWQSYFPLPFHVDREILKQNTVGSPVFDWGASALEVCDEELWGFVAVKKSANPLLYPGTGGDVYHLSALAYTEPEYGVDLLSQTKHILKNRGAHSLVFGMDSRHFFPGCPVDVSTLCNFLMVEGFEKEGEYFDVERDLADYEMPIAPVKGVEYREVREGDMEACRSFLQREFPGRWTYDVMDKARVEGAANTLFGVFEGGRMLGFALIQDWRHKQPIAGGVWRMSLGEKWGSLGPIGIAKEERGRGLGDSLLGMALLNLKSRGVRRCLIDWTTLDTFYGKHGFEVTRRYKKAVLRLE